MKPAKPGQITSKPAQEEPEIFVPKKGRDGTYLHNSREFLTVSFAMVGAGALALST